MYAADLTEEYVDFNKGDVTIRLRWAADFSPQMDTEETRTAEIQKPPDFSSGFCVSIGNRIRNRQSVGCLRAFDVDAFSSTASARAVSHRFFRSDAVRLSLSRRCIFCSRRCIRLDPAFGKLAGLNVLERGFHPFLHAGVNDFRADADVAPLGGFGNGKRMPLMPASFIRSTISFNSCRHSK
jgi:hypothetical protein